MSRYRTSPRPLAGALGALGEELSPGTLLADAQRHWAAAVGPAVAAESAPIAEGGGVLRVTCSSSLWAHELDLMSPVILSQLNALLKRGSISRLRCVTGFD